MNRGFFNVVGIVIFVTIVFLFFSILRSIIDTTNDIDQMKEVKSEVGI